MKTLIALIVALACSNSFAGEVWIPESTYRPGPPPATCRSCRTYSIPVANYYRIVRDPYTGHVYSREYIGTRYEQRTYCVPRWNDLDRWSIDTGYGDYR